MKLALGTGLPVPGMAIAGCHGEFGIGNQVGQRLKAGQGLCLRSLLRFLVSKRQNPVGTAVPRIPYRLPQRLSGYVHGLDNRPDLAAGCLFVVGGHPADPRLRLSRHLMVDHGRDHIDDFRQLKGVLRQEKGNRPVMFLPWSTARQTPRGAISF